MISDNNVFLLRAVTIVFCVYIRFFYFCVQFVYKMEEKFNAVVPVKKNPRGKVSTINYNHYYYYSITILYQYQTNSTNAPCIHCSLNTN